MSGDVVIPARMTIPNGMVQFCSRELVADVNRWEQYFSSQELADGGYPNLGGTSTEAKQRRDDPRRGVDYRRRLEIAWKAVLRDFRDRLEQGEIVVTGVQVYPDPATERVVIPGAWATDLKIDALKNTIEFGQERYLSIQVGLPDAFTGDEAVSHRAGALKQSDVAIPAITPENVRELSDDEVLLLLEDHARRVVEGPNARLFSGKLSLMPIIARKMRHRAARGELLPSLVNEATALAHWIRTAAPSHQSPTIGSIENHIRTEYATLKAQSNAMKP